MITDRRYWQAVAEITNCPQPEWVWRLGFSPAARRILAALQDAPRTSDELSQVCGYSYATLKCTLTALTRLGQIERPTNYKLEPNLWYVKGMSYEPLHDVAG